MGNTTKKQRKEAATELALLLYDIYVETSSSDNMQKGQNDAETIKDE